MTYRIWKFVPLGGSELLLPVHEAEHDAGAGQVLPSVIALPGGGGYDMLGAEEAPKMPSVISCRGILMASTPTDLESELAAWLAATGKRGTVWRKGASTAHWCVGRLQQTIAPRTVETDLGIELNLTFVLPMPIWHGAAHDDTTVLDASPKTIALVNGGNARVTNPIITVTASGSEITAITVKVTGVSEIEWSGTLAAGKNLVIDCGAKSVRADGVDAYSGFSLGSEHTIPDWLRLEPGNNSVVITRTGGDESSTVRFEYCDGWA